MAARARLGHGAAHAAAAAKRESQKRPAHKRGDSKDGLGTVAGRASFDAGSTEGTTPPFMPTAFASLAIAGGARLLLGFDTDAARDQLVQTVTAAAETHATALREREAAAAKAASVLRVRQPASHGIFWWPSRWDAHSVGAVHCWPVGSRLLAVVPGAVQAQRRCAVGARSLHRAAGTAGRVGRRRHAQHVDDPPGAHHSAADGVQHEPADPADRGLVQRHRRRGRTHASVAGWPPARRTNDRLSRSSCVFWCCRRTATARSYGSTCSTTN